MYLQTFCHELSRNVIRQHYTVAEYLRYKLNSNGHINFDSLHVKLGARGVWHSQILHSLYRVTHLLADLGWVDLYLVCSTADGPQMQLQLLTAHAG